MSTSTTEELALAFVEKELRPDPDYIWDCVDSVTEGTLTAAQVDEVVDAAAKILDSLATALAAQSAPAYKSVIPSRSPETKIHETLGRARSAVAYSRRWGPGARGGQIYERRIGDWVLLHDIPRGTEELPWHAK